MPPSFEKSLETARRVAQLTAEAGGRAYYVGGFVRDGVMGIPCKDVDIEIHGITPEKLREILTQIGHFTAMGESFGVYSLNGVDIAMPRREKAVGRGHRDFEIYVDPYLGPRKAAMRRDFTMNAMMRDVLTGELLDPFGGLGDIERRIIRHVSDDSFPEDALRVFRCAQFAARFGFEVAPETMTLCGTMDLDALPRERVMGEAEKSLLKAAAPSRFFRVLKEMGRLSPWFRELAALSDADFSETMRLTDACAARISQAEQPMSLMMAAVCASLTGRERKSLMERLTGEIALLRNTDNLCELYAGRAPLLSPETTPEALAVLDDALCRRELLLLCECGGSAPAYLLQKHEQAYMERLSVPRVMGADLVAAGLAPGKAVGEGVRYARKLWLKGACREDALRETLRYLQTMGG